MANQSPIDMIEIAAVGLGDLLGSVVFVGGAITSLYQKDVAAPNIRPTKDVDCIIEIAGRIKYYHLEEKLRKLGFKNDITSGTICRWIYNDVTVDVMPIDEKILGFSNKWYPEGMSNTMTAILPSGREISILTLPYFVATKIEAFKGRGGGDYRMSEDIEDIVIVLDGQVDFEQMRRAPASVKQYLKAEFKKLSSEDQFLESAAAYIGYTKTSTGRAIRVLDFMKDYSIMG
jgi:predicted nucleotidyltransferase